MRGSTTRASPIFPRTSAEVVRILLSSSFRARMRGSTALSSFISPRDFAAILRTSNPLLYCNALIKPSTSPFFLIFSTFGFKKSNIPIFNLLIDKCKAKRGRLEHKCRQSHRIGILLFKCI